MVRGQSPMYSCGSSVAAGPLAPWGGRASIGCGAPLGAAAGASPATVVASPPDIATGPLGEYPASQHPRPAPPSGPGESPPDIAGRRPRAPGDVQPRDPVTPCHAGVGRPDGLCRPDGICVQRTTAIRLLRGNEGLPRPLPKLDGAGGRVRVRNRGGGPSREPSGGRDWHAVHADCRVRRADRLVDGRPPLPARGGAR